MAAEPTGAPDEAQEPVADTPEAEPEQPAEDTPQPEQKVDWEARYREQAKLHARQEKELGLYRRGKAPEPDGEQPEAEPEVEEASADAPTPVIQEQYNGESLLLAAAVYGESAKDAYLGVLPLLDRATTHADWVTALEAYHDRRSAGDTPKAAAAKAKSGSPTKAEAVQPQVDTNRSDAGPDPSIQQKVEEAKGKGDLAGFVRAKLSEIGL